MQPLNTPHHHHTYPGITKEHTVVNIMDPVAWAKETLSHTLELSVMMYPSTCCPAPLDPGS